MIRPDPNVIKSVATAIRQYPEILGWLESLLTHELRRLPYAVDSPAVFQGRCQILSELTEFIKEAPAVAAKLK